MLGCFDCCLLDIVEVGVSNNRIIEVVDPRLKKQKIVRCLLGM